MGHIAGISDEVNSISELHKQVGRRSEKKLEPLIVRKALMELIDPLVQHATENPRSENCLVAGQYRKKNE